MPVEQLGLFPQPGAGRGESAPPSERLAREHAAAAATARRLPAQVRFGTSSWSFPGWAGIVYSRRAGAGALARDGLAEYVRHPLLRTVGIDRGFYGPVPPEDLARWASQLPAGFPCSAKAPEAVTSPLSFAAPGRRLPEPNPDFLSSGRFVDEMVGPFLEGLAGHLGPFLLQFPPRAAEAKLAPAEFARRLDRFLAALPKAASYACELRDPTLLGEEYRETLARHGAAHVYSFSAAMPLPAEQARRVPLAASPFVVLRLLLPPGTRYQERRQRFAPFDRVVEADATMRRQVVALTRAACALGRQVIVLVNNKAEGSAPLTIRALAEMLAKPGEEPEAAADVAGGGGS